MTVYYYQHGFKCAACYPDSGIDINISYGLSKHCFDHEFVPYRLLSIAYDFPREKGLLANFAVC